MTPPETSLIDRIGAALSEAGAFCGECDFQLGETGCPDCVRVREMYAEALFAVVQPELTRMAAEINHLITGLMPASQATETVTPAEHSLPACGYEDCRC